MLNKIIHLACLWRSQAQLKCSLVTKPLQYLNFRFILMVRRGYRDPPYHNWIHAFSVAHFCFAAITNLKLVERRMLRFEIFPEFLESKLFSFKFNLPLMFFFPTKKRNFEYAFKL